MRKFKILYLSSGASVHTIRWVNSLSKKSNITINLVSQQKLVDNLSEKVIFNLLPFRGSLGYILNIFKLKKIIKDWEPDLIHASYASGYGFTANLLNFHPLVLSVWGSDIFEFPRKSYIHRKLIELNLNNADVISSTSFVMAKEINNLVKNKKVVITPFGIDINQFKNNKTLKKEEIITIGTIKNLSKIYGIDILIKGFAIAYKKLIKKDLALAKKMRLKIVGSGDQKQILLDLISSLNLKDIVSLKDRVKHNLVPLEMEEISIFCALSRQESFGVAVLEASALGIPVIVSNKGGLPEVVINEKTGLIIDNLNPECASKAIIRLVRDYEFRRFLGSNGREFVSKKYNWNDSLDIINKIYQTLLIKKNNI
tara:strand:+ start:135 stop:1241 length:1107 start_codon:yes stop_codon:yes gene_type:complete